MRSVFIDTIPGFEAWRDAARGLIAEAVPPSEVVWQTKGAQQDNLFTSVKPSPVVDVPPLKVSKQFVELADAVSCHSNEDRFDLLYRLLWRLKFENRNLLHMKTDADVMKAQSYARVVYRDAYKITAFLRFRGVAHEGQEQFIAWYEPFHYTLERVMPFFTTRFKNMRWSILTPYRAAYWNGQQLTLSDNPDPSEFPDEDSVEGYWLTYYANIFNPARPKKAAMMTQMPKKYWKNMPEAKLIGPLLRESEKRAKAMIERD